MNTKITHTPDGLQKFISEVFTSVVRKDQRTTSSFYLQGLDARGPEKSMQPIAKRLGIDHQRLQRFVFTSPWPVEPVRKALAIRIISLIEPAAWVVDNTGFIKVPRGH